MSFIKSKKNLKFGLGFKTHYYSPVLSTGLTRLQRGAPILWAPRAPRRPHTVGPTYL